MFIPVARRHYDGKGQCCGERRSHVTLQKFLACVPEGLAKPYGASQHGLLPGADPGEERKEVDYG